MPSSTTEFTTSLRPEPTELQRSAPGQGGFFFGFFLFIAAILVFGFVWF